MINVFEGKDVDVIEPFPLTRLAAAVQWMRCYKTAPIGDDGPQTNEELHAMLEGFLTHPNTRSFAVVDKNNLTKAKEFDSPLVALITFERHFGYRNGYVAVASARRAWGEKLCQPGLVQQASQLVIDQLFESEPTLNRLSLTTLAANTAAKNFALRLGFRKDGYFLNLAQSKGVGANVIHMGLQRPVAA